MYLHVPRKEKYKAWHVLLGFIVLVLSTSVCASIYRYKSNDGSVVYSDAPQQGATQVILPPLSHYSEPSLPEKTKTVNRDKPIEKMSTSQAYQSVTIINLKNNDTVRNNNTLALIVKAHVKPQLQKGDQALLLIDDKSMAKGSIVASDLSFTLQGVNRGSHWVKVVIVNGTTQQLISSSKAIKVYFQQNSVRRLLTNKASETESVP